MWCRHNERPPQLFFYYYQEEISRFEGIKTFTFIGIYNDTMKIGVQ